MPNDPVRARRAAALALSLLLLLVGGQAVADPLVEGAPTEESRGAVAAGEAAEAGARNPSATEIIRGLAPFADGNPGAPALSVQPADGGPRIRMNTGRTVDLTVFFAYDSARLTPEARIQLEPLGRALASAQLVRHGFLIAGHTDAAGGAAYNRRLSLARARAVKAHLVEAYGIDPDRLRMHGWGQSRLKRPDAPLDPVNRRVEVGLIAPPSAARDGGHRDARDDRERLAEVWSVCGRLDDPRDRAHLDLDDFAAAPTPLPCTD